MKKKKTGGRKRGVSNKLTRTAKEAFNYAFNQLGGADGLAAWAAESNENKTVFFRLFSRLIPIDVMGDVNFTVTCAIPAPPNSIKPLPNSQPVIDVTPITTNVEQKS